MKAASICAALSLCAAALFPLACSAQTWPTKSVRIVVPFAPGGTSDMLGRVVASKLTESLGQQFVVENRAGAGGVVGSELVAKSAPDGYVLVVSGVASHAIAPAMSTKFPYDPVKDFSHIALFGGPPAVLAIHPSIPARDVKTLIALARKQPGVLTYGSPGSGTQGHLFGELFKQIAGVDMVHVPYKGASGAVTDLIAGHIDAVSTTLSTASVQIHAGRARALAVSSAARLPEYPAVPTFRELGYPQLVAVVWFALSGPPGMAPETVNRLNAEVRRILQLPDVRERLKPEAIDPGTLDPRAFSEFVGAEARRWGPVVRAAGVRAD